MSSFKIQGFDKLEKELKQLQKNAKKLSNTKQVSFQELFPASFMKKYTSFSSMEEFLYEGGFDVQSTEDFEAIPEDLFDKYIASTTNFKSWEEMLQKATSQYAIKKLGF